MPDKVYILSQMVLDTPFSYQEVAKNKIIRAKTIYIPIDSSGKRIGGAIGKTTTIRPKEIHRMGGDNGELISYYTDLKSPNTELNNSLIFKAFFEGGSNRSKEVKTLYKGGAPIALSMGGNVKAFHEGTKKLFGITSIEKPNNVRYGTEEEYIKYRNSPKGKLDFKMFSRGYPNSYPRQIEKEFKERYLNSHHVYDSLSESLSNYIKEYI